jgi:hypothetical protein
MTHTFKNKFGDTVEVTPVALTHFPGFILMQEKLSGQPLVIHNSCIKTTYTPEEIQAYASKSIAAAIQQPDNNPS